MRRAVWVTIVVLGVGLTAVGVARVVAEDQGMDHQKATTGHHGMMGHRGGMMGQQMMGFCPFSTQGAEIHVTPTKAGVTIDVTASDPTAIARIQKKAKILQLMHELRALGPGPEESHESHESDQADPQAS